MSPFGSWRLLGGGAWVVQGRGLGAAEATHLRFCQGGRNISAGAAALLLPLLALMLIIYDWQNTTSASAWPIKSHRSHRADMPAN